MYVNTGKGTLPPRQYFLSQHTFTALSIFFDLIDYYALFKVYAIEYLASYEEVFFSVHFHSLALKIWMFAKINLQKSF